MSEGGRVVLSHTSSWTIGDRVGYDKERYPTVGSGTLTEIHVGIDNYHTSERRIRPVLFTGYESGRQAGTIVHAVLGSATPDITLRPAQRRAGEFELLFDSEHAAAAAESLLARGELCSVLSQERDSVEMVFVVTGRISRTLDDDTRDMWLVRFGFQELDPTPTEAG